MRWRRERRLGRGGRRSRRVQAQIQLVTVLLAFAFLHPITPLLQETSEGEEVLMHPLESSSDVFESLRDPLLVLKSSVHALLLQRLLLLGEFMTELGVVGQTLLPQRAGEELITKTKLVVELTDPVTVPHLGGQNTQPRSEPQHRHRPTDADNRTEWERKRGGDNDDEKDHREDQSSQNPAFVLLLEASNSLSNFRAKTDHIHLLPRVRDFVPATMGQ
ncbi:MAG: hypothetical protein QG633_98 [Patescibacteria group bacterium]|nr:hypothetical protein [Patescibacteria group bacterium]